MRELTRRFRSGKPLRKSPAAALLVLGLVLTACGGDRSQAVETAQAGEGEFSVVVRLNEFSVEMDREDVPLGVPVTFFIINDGATDHDLVLELPGAENEPLMNADGSETRAPALHPGQEATISYTFTLEGTYQLGCHLPGHYKAGMARQFRVRR